MRETTKKRITLASLFFTLAAFAISANAVPPLISVMSSDTGIRISDFGLFLFLQFIAFAVASFAGGAIRKRFGVSNHALITLGLVIIALAFVVGSLWLRSWISLVLWVIPLGLSGGAVETFSSIEIATLSESDSSKNLCLSQVFYSLGAFAAPQIVYVSLGLGLSWNGIFLVFAFFSGFVVVIFLLLRQKRFVWTQMRNEQRVETTKNEGRSSGTNLLFYFLMLLMLCYVTLESLSAAWLALVFEQEFSMGAGHASLVLAGFWGGMVFGRFSIVFLPKQFTLWPTMLVTTVLLLLSSVALWFFDSLSVKVLAVVALGAAAGPMWPVIVMTSSSAFASDGKTAVIIGMGALGFASGPIVGSVIIESGLSFYHAVQVLLATMVVMVTYSSFLISVRRQTTP